MSEKPQIRKIQSHSSSYVTKVGTIDFLVEIRITEIPEKI